MNRAGMILLTLWAIDCAILFTALVIMTISLVRKAFFTHTDSSNRDAMVFSAAVLVVGLSIAAALFDATHPGVQFSFSVRKVIVLPATLLGNCALFFWIKGHRQRGPRT